MQKLPKSKNPRHDGQMNNWRWITIAIAFVFLSACFVFSIDFYRSLTTEPYYDNVLLRDLDVENEDTSLIEDRLLNYLIIGDSTRDEVDEFSHVHLRDSHYPCNTVNESESTCYNIIVQPIWGCKHMAVVIVFNFEQDILSSIEFGNSKICV